jgi:ATP-dependent Clp protease ATP-binding subunit ClpC
MGAMFERFTNRARRVLVLAQEEARLLQHDFLGTEHLLLGLLHEGEGVGALVLKELGFQLEPLREEVRSIIPPTVDTAPSKPPFTPRSKKVLELALREAVALKHNYIGTEHLLLAVVREGEGVAAQILVSHNFTHTAVRERVITKLAGYGGEHVPGPPPTASTPGHTPAMSAIIPKAEALAQGTHVGSQHLLHAILDEPDSLAARAIASFGVTREALRARFDEIGVEGTTDEVAAPAPFDVDAGGDTVTIRIKDPALAERVRRGELTVTFTEDSA